MKASVLEGVNVAAVKQHPSRGRLVKVFDEVNQCTLSTSAPSDDCECFASFGFEGDALEDDIPWPRWVREVNVLKSNVALSAPRCIIPLIQRLALVVATTVIAGTPLAAARCSRPVENLEYFCACSAALDQVAERVEQHVAPVLQHVEEEHKPRELLKVNFTSKEEVGAVPNDQNPHCSVHEKGGDEHVVKPIDDGLLHVQVEVLRDFLLVPLVLVFLVRERVDHPEAREDLLGDRVRLGEAVLHADRILPQELGVEPVRPSEQRHGGASDEGEPPVGVEQRERDAQDAGHRLDGEPEHPCHVVSQGGDVGREPARQLARWRDVKVSYLLSQDLLEQLQTQTLDQPALGVAEEVHAPEVQDCINAPGARHELDRAPHLVSLVTRQLGEHESLEVRHRDRKRHPYEEHDATQRKPGALLQHDSPYRPSLNPRTIVLPGGLRRGAPRPPSLLQQRLVERLLHCPGKVT
mmetsp:Transcript_6490/g.19192  ORF Transcript_6490/g.19192 Transcript_6490/m.19192 type:complete len:466 (+) Transcript_6490:628-2025(+)